MMSNLKRNKNEKLKINFVLQVPELIENLYNVVLNIFCLKFQKFGAKG